eukprot:CAMPEP_0170519296 /NCGR_PEP_ID=MMETSP0209-20121228/4774_1 /TAXON_ID=665100 ORGANISM="Litonotus pictus, Strain P1" /NCGR_SAMPLE_ID=MMETSP0209 /ASSEMBLY_ACC=CAM_ASM_000301 /LENGTH=69 /DNA_ID=CAMNT_0010805155 /DNA_START=385 /DNA_END=594 /DNA_ORIENTATION=-
MLDDTWNSVKALVQVYELRDFTNLTSIRQILSTARQCSSEVFDRMVKALKDILGVPLFAEADFELMAYS